MRWKNKKKKKGEKVHVLMLEGFTGYQTSQRLILFALSIRLPPIRILLRDDVQHITLLKTDTQFPARYIRIFLRVVIEVGPYVLYLENTRPF